MNSRETTVLEIENSSLLCDSSTLDQLLSKKAESNESSSEQPAIRGGASTFVGTLVGLTDTGVPLVHFAPNRGEEIPARSVCAVTQQDVGREAVLVLENGDLQKPIILGLLQSNVPKAVPEPVNVSVDGEVVTFTARNEIVLRCGKASITLTRAGKILIRGAYLLSRSSGVNRIKGGSVQIN